jgi:hypothetical protein
MFGRASRGGRMIRIRWEIDVEDWWEELGGGQSEPMKSQVRVF